MMALAQIMMGATLAKDPETPEEVHEYSEFDLVLTEGEVPTGGYLQLQMKMTARKSYETVTIDWGDGKIESLSDYVIWHNYKASGRYRVKIGPEAAWWRLVDASSTDSSGSSKTARPQIFPVSWADTLESANGTYCGWNNSEHGGVQGTVIPWGKSLTDVTCCYQLCTDITGPFPEWTSTIKIATGAFDGCKNLTGKIPPWGKNMTDLNQVYCDCVGLTGSFPLWPRNAKTTSSCYKNVTGLVGTLPPWPECATDLSDTYNGAIGAQGAIPAWPATITNVNRCYKNCASLTSAWTENAAELMPEEKLKHPDDETYIQAEETVSGTSESLRALFYTTPWGGTKTRE